VQKSGVPIAQTKGFEREINNQEKNVEIEWKR